MSLYVREIVKENDMHIESKSYMFKLFRKLIIQHLNKKINSSTF